MSSRYSPDLADELQSGELDVALLRVEPRPDVAYRVIAREPLVVIPPSDHRLAAETSIDPHDLEGEILVGFSNIPHVLRDIVDRYFRRIGIALTPAHRIDSFAMGMSLVASTRGVALADLCRAATAVVGRQPTVAGRAARHRSRGRMTAEQRVTDPANVPERRRSAHCGSAGWRAESTLAGIAATA